MLALVSCRQLEGTRSAVLWPVHVTSATVTVQSWQATSALTLALTVKLYRRPRPWLPRWLFPTPSSPPQAFLEPECGTGCT
ncbi:predicted protein [Plenodomus lingam JN3]|uniref:Predicted protein n=1 Tax=Leptosphaeria maculans (strain JN3 / isolate v23.1.3 / race Av1-4-5-6-7-8) TaxID=985895 RepID=E4ZXN2_LEPMJ|nr:predicted protein [Plenodomus lingam JN3]CBX96127.1 predicted protein [Plenodomus lingam JN3]